MDSSPIPVAEGRRGIAWIVATCNRLKDFYGAQPLMRTVALQIIGRVGDHDQTAQLARLVEFVRAAVVYVADPIDLEFIQTPDRLLHEIFTQGSTRGDCDDHCVLLAALAQAVGLPCEIVGVQSPAAATLPDHVIVVAYPESGPVEIDPCAKGFPQLAYPEKLFAR